MSKNVDYYFTPVSPFTYLGHARFVAIARARHATIGVKPVDLGRVFPVSGGLPLRQRAPQRQAYRLVELKRWSSFLQMPLNPQPAHFPVPADLAAKWVLAVLERGTQPALDFTGALGRAIWAEDRNIADRDTLAAIATTLGTTPRHSTSAPTPPTSRSATTCSRRRRSSAVCSARRRTCSAASSSGVKIGSTSSTARWQNSAFCSRRPVSPGCRIEETAGARGRQRARAPFLQASAKTMLRAGRFPSTSFSGRVRCPIRSSSRSPAR